LAKLTKPRRFFVTLAVVVLQLFMTQVVTFLVSLLVPDMEGFPMDHPGPFVLMLGATFTTGIFLVGWAALKLGWLKAMPRYGARLVGTLVGAYAPLLIALVVYRALEPGNPFFMISILAGIAGFHLPDWTGAE
jgi:energy-converting hydrogenase Eha subunit A